LILSTGTEVCMQN